MNFVGACKFCLLYSCYFVLREITGLLEVASTVLLWYQIFNKQNNFGSEVFGKSVLNM